MSIVETEIWEVVPSIKPRCRFVGMRKAGKVFQELRTFLHKENIYPDDYFLMNSSF